MLSIKINVKMLVYFLLFIIFAGSVGLNIFFLYGKGIHVHNTYNQQQYQNQQQAQVMVGLFTARGRLYRKLVTSQEIIDMGIKGDTPFQRIHNFLETLPTEQQLFPIIAPNGLDVSIPALKTKENK